MPPRTYNPLELKLALLSVVLVFASIWLWAHKEPSPVFAHHPVARVTSLERAIRPNYPYSVVPGGVYNRSELAARIAADPVVRRHYAEFAVGQSHLVVLDRDTSAYASYRLKNAVYWTHKKLKLFRGETLLSDGRQFTRTRCGNRLSETLPPGAPRNVAADPVAELNLPVFDSELFRTGRVPALQLPVDDAEVSPPMAQQLLKTAVTPNPIDAPVIPITPTGPMLTGVGAPPPSFATTTPVGGPIVPFVPVTGIVRPSAPALAAVPEPATPWLLALLTLALLFARRLHTSL